jgi:chromosome segregation ATPase
MSAATALPRDSVGNILKTNNTLTTDFFFDTDAAKFDTSGTTPSKNLEAQKSQERPPHTTLLATPLNRSAGGHVKQKPSPSILESKYLSKHVFAAKAAVGNSPATKATLTPLSAGMKRTVASPSYATPLSNKFTAAANPISTGRTTNTTSPSASLLNASSDIKARLRHLAATTPITTTKTGSTSRSYAHTITPISSSTYSATKDFRIASTGSRTSQFTPHSAESLAARSRANQMQAELQLKDLEVHKLAAAAAEARKERDEQKYRADKLEAIASNAIRSSPNSGVKINRSPYGGTTNSTPPPARNTGSFYQNQMPQQAQQASVQSPSSSTPAPTSAPSNEAQVAVSELRREAETLRQQVEMAASELQGQRTRADAAEERARLAEARAGAESSALESNENELRSLRQKVFSMQNEVRRLATELAIAEDRAGLAETSLAEERNRSRGGSNSNNGSGNTSSSSAALTEVALTAQVRALATQLKVAKTEAATAQQELAAFTAEAHGQSAIHEDTTASILSANRELEAALAQASQNLELRADELEQSRGAVARLAAENAALHAALKDRDEQYSALMALHNNNNSTSDVNVQRANVAELKLAQVQQELKSAKTRIADMEHAMSRNSNQNNLYSNMSNGPSPLRDIVGNLRTELEDRELRLAAAEEELATERRRANDLHRQVLDQAVEIDDLQRETHRGDDNLRKELEQARNEAHAAAQEVAAMRQSQEDVGAAVGSRGTNITTSTSEVELTRERNRLREELDARESEVMALQGQLNMLVMMNNTGGRGAGGGGGFVEVDSWLTGA